MNADKLREFIEKLPIMPIFVIFLCWLGYGYYQFTSAGDSPLVQKTTEEQRIKTEISQYQAKVKQIDEFVKGLEAKRNSMRFLATELDSMKATLSESLDVPGFMTSVVTEAKRVGVIILSLRPGAITTKEYYAEQVFDLSFRGIFVQLIVFLERLSNMQKIVRIENMEMKVIGSNLARYVELDGTLQLKVYKYAGSKADELAKNTAKQEGKM
ncbi:MAG: type 4a pilus biogenesis protein PilO [Bdellovibrionota bacterium]|mgnify:CR=1 FL=1